MLEGGRVVTVRMLLKGLYEKACQQKLWGLVRHTAGMLGKRVEDLAKAVTDLLVRQKQVSNVVTFTYVWWIIYGELMECICQTSGVVALTQKIRSNRWKLIEITF